MKRFIALLTLIVPTIALGANRFDYYPTTREIYENCKDAVELAEAGDIQGFYKSSCAIRIEGISSGIRYAIFESLPYATDAQDPNAQPKLPSSYVQRFCFLKKFDKNYPELDLAKRFVQSVESIKDKPDFETYMNGRRNPDITSIFHDICNAELEK
jgi:hypothetical protein